MVHWRFTLVLLVAAGCDSRVATAGELTEVDLGEAGIVAEIEGLANGQRLEDSAFFWSAIHDDGTSDWWNAKLLDRDVQVSILFWIASPQHVADQPAGLPVVWTSYPGAGPPYARARVGADWRYVG